MLRRSAELSIGADAQVGADHCPAKRDATLNGEWVMGNGEWGMGVMGDWVIDFAHYPPITYCPLPISHFPAKALPLALFRSDILELVRE